MMFKCQKSCHSGYCWVSVFVLYCSSMKCLYVATFTQQAKDRIGVFSQEVDYLHYG